jgi:hypothetical protein
LKAEQETNLSGNGLVCIAAAPQAHLESKPKAKAVNWSGLAAPLHNGWRSLKDSFQGKSVELVH